MKKIGYVFLLLMMICLTSCGSKEEGRKKIIDSPATEISSALGLDNVKSGVSIAGEIDTTQSYWDVKIAQDLEGSLFYQTIDIEDVINDKLKQVIIKPLFFHRSLYSEDLSQFCIILNSAAEMAKRNVEVSFVENEYSKLLLGTENEQGEAIAGTISPALKINLPENYKKVENDPAKLIVVYVPIYGVFNDGVEDYTNVFVMVPVYYAFAYESNIATYTSGIKNYEPVFNKYLDNNGNEIYLLPSATE